MPEYDDTTITQTIPRSSPRPRRFDRSRERYPRDGSVQEVYVEQRQFTRDNHHPKGHLAIRHDEFIRSPRHLSRSADPSRRHPAFRSEDTQSSEDSDSSAEHRNPRAISRRKSARHLKVSPRSDKHADNPFKSRTPNNARNHTRNHTSNSDSDSGYSSHSDNDEKQRKHRNRKLLYTGLACVTTVAAANNIYQNTKAYQARHNRVPEGEMHTSEVKRLKNKALLMDFVTVGVVAVGINNARMGWKRVEDIGRERK